MFEGLTTFVLGGLDELAESTGECVSGALTTLSDQASTPIPHRCAFRTDIAIHGPQIYDEMSLVWKENLVETKEGTALRESIEKMHKEMLSRYKTSLTWGDEEV